VFETTYNNFSLKKRRILRRKLADYKSENGVGGGGHLVPVSEFIYPVFAKTGSLKFGHRISVL
jgi:hypothetical protein